MRVADPPFIACEELLWIQADGNVTKLVAKVGTPYKVDDHLFRCPVELTGLDERYPDIAGESSMQALCLATSLLATRLGHLLEAGERLAYAREPGEGQSAWDVDSINAVFGR